MTTTDPTTAHADPTHPADRSREQRRWWRRPWVAPLVVVSVVFVAFSLPAYLTGDPADARVPIPEHLGALYYPLLVAHVVFGSIALLTCGLQVWPRFRHRHPVAHRRIGRLYVGVGVLPAGTIGLVLAAVSPFGPVARVSGVLMSSLWLTFTIVGFRMARQRRHVEHRRWMIRSFALTASIITNRVWSVVWVLVLWPQLDTTYHGDETLLIQTVAGITAWLSWVSVLLIAEWWLERDAVSAARAGRR
jgi:uncharacterized membrane protein YozB (DUF420 family)